MKCYKCQRNMKMNLKSKFGTSFECTECKTLAVSAMTYYTHKISTTGVYTRRTYTEAETRFLLREETI